MIFCPWLVPSRQSYQLYIINTYTTYQCTEECHLLPKLHTSNMSTKFIKVTKPNLSISHYFPVNSSSIVVITWRSRNRNRQAECTFVYYREKGQPFLAHCISLLLDFVIVYIYIYTQNHSNRFDINALVLKHDISFADAPHMHQLILYTTKNNLS